MPSRFRVRTGHALGLLLLVMAHPSLTSTLLALPLAVTGEAIRIWASGHIDKTRALATGGPYAHSRNPLYVGSLLMALGLGVASASPWVVAAAALYFLAFYPAVMREEASFLRQKFPEIYEGWAKDVPLFVPRLTPGGPRSSRFSWAQVAANREWRTAAAIPLILVLLELRGRWLP